MVFRIRVDCSVLITYVGWLIEGSLDYCSGVGSARVTERGCNQILLVYVNHELTNSPSNRTPKLYDRIVKLRNEHLRFRIPEIAQNIHPNKQESKVQKLLPEASKNRKSQFPEQGEIGGKSKRVCG
ncbi:hypothetical protein GQ457_01G017120 [Hibiscus cannabinus]